jgi:sugar/nucleoside kinase (ribokinase family)
MTAAGGPRSRLTVRRSVVGRSVPGRPAVVGVVNRLPRPRHAPAVLVLGDLMLDVVLAPSRALETGTDVPGRVQLRQGGSAAGTARWLGRLGARVQLVTAVGRDSVGRALVDAVRRDGVQVRAARPSGRRTGRIGILVSSGGERSFVADRGAADGIEPEMVQEAWFDRLDALHLPAYSLLTEPLGSAARRAIEIARRRGARVTLDLASSVPLLARGQRNAEAVLRDVRPDVLFATEAEARALLDERPLEALLEFAPVAIVKRGVAGATVLARGTAPDAIGAALRFEVATKAMEVADSTGAGDAFDAGFLVAWLDAEAGREQGSISTAALRRATLAGHRVAARHLARPVEELALG